jgi:prepilin-type processing-associated H-X9-DG protein/prepilin-type N-terminal cleavage/methylation domain-containing protein
MTVTPPPRGGLTLIETLVVLAIISLLVGALLPAASQARDAGRRVQCLNNMRQIGLALIQQAGRKGRLPASGNFSATGPEQYFSWVVPVLGDLDHSEVADAWSYDRPFNDSAGSKNAALAQTSLSVLVCPSDASVAPGQGNLSFVVNGGFGWTRPVDCPVSPHWAGVAQAPQMVAMDFSGDGRTCDGSADPYAQSADKVIYLRTGLFFVENWPSGTGTSRHYSLTSVTDGAAQTLMLAENVRGGYDPVWRSNWADPWPPRNSFFVSGYVCAGGSCKRGSVDYARANDRSAVPQQAESLNSALDQAEGEAPWPSSFHPGGVNVVFCDGHGRFLSQDVQGAVYAALVSPQGMRLGNYALAQQPVGEDY